MGQKLRGLVAQGVSGRKSYRDAMLELVGGATATSGTGSITAPRACQAMIWAWGPGGSGSSTGPGGGGGGALFKRLTISPGQKISWAIGTPGGAGANPDGQDGTDTTVTLPSGLVMTAGAGKGAPDVPFQPGGDGGLATGGDLNRPGGKGATDSTANAQSGGLGGGIAGGGTGAGGGAAGFSDQTVGGLADGGAGGNNDAAGVSPGGGSGTSSGIPKTGGAGKVVVLLFRARA
jgi:hypothetical protein